MAPSVRLHFITFEGTPQCGLSRFSVTRITDRSLPKGQNTSTMTVKNGSANSKSHFATLVSNVDRAIYYAAVGFERAVAESTAAKMQ